MTSYFLPHRLGGFIDSCLGNKNLQNLELRLAYTPGYKDRFGNTFPHRQIFFASRDIQHNELLYYSYQFEAGRGKWMEGPDRMPSDDNALVRKMQDCTLSEGGRFPCKTVGVGGFAVSSQSELTRHTQACEFCQAPVSASDVGHAEG